MLGEKQLIRHLPISGLEAWSWPELGEWRLNSEHVWDFEIVIEKIAVIWLEASTGLFYKFSPQRFLFWCLIHLLSFQLQLLKLSSPETVGLFTYLLNWFYHLLFLASIFKPLFYFFKHFTSKHIFLLGLTTEFLKFLHMWFFCFVFVGSFSKCLISLCFRSVTVSWIIGLGILSVGFLWGPGWNCGPPAYCLGSY